MRKGKWLIFISVALLLTGIKTGWDVYEGYKKGQEEYLDVRQRYLLTEGESESDAGQESRENGGDTESQERWPEDAPKQIVVDWEELKKENEDIVAWLYLPAVDLSYPVVQSDDNEYYLHRSVRREELFAGSIFMDYYNSPDLKNYNTILYGHNMRDGSMFAKLKEYKNPETIAQCPYFWISTPMQDCLYRIFSIHTAGTQSSTYTVRFPDATSYREWLEKMDAASEVETGAELNESETVVTLSTCTGDSALRQVVQGIRIAENQNKRK
ncbi:MAG: class B sortase [Lachnospiraceae bacterium]|nr:class B sortase [Lachnospiraceae bacterium]